MPVRWNRAGTSIPLPAIVGPGRPQDVERNVSPEYGKAQQQPVRLQGERVSAGAEWLVFASSQGKDGVTIVGGALNQAECAGTTPTSISSSWENLQALHHPAAMPSSAGSSGGPAEERSLLLMETTSNLTLRCFHEPADYF